MSPSPNGKICTVIRECAAGDFERAVLRSRQDSDLLEFRLDFLDPSQLTLERMQRWVALAGVPVIATLRRKLFGGRFEGGAAEQLEMLGRIGGAGFSFLDIEVETLEALRPPQLKKIREGSGRLIGSYHDFRETPADLQSIFQRILAVKADVVKIATLAGGFADNLRLLELVSRARRQGLSIIAVAMGELGAYSRLVAPSRGAMLDLRLHSCRPGDGPRATDLAGPEMRLPREHHRPRHPFFWCDRPSHRSLPVSAGGTTTPSRQLGLNCRYLPLPTPRLEPFAPYLQCFGGLSVTIPHKVAVLKYVGARHRSVEESGAANTLVRRGNGLRAYNTDLDGVRHALRGCLDGSPGPGRPARSRRSRPLRRRRVEGSPVARHRPGPESVQSRKAGRGLRV